MGVNPKHILRFVIVCLVAAIPASALAQADDEEGPIGEMEQVPVLSASQQTTRGEQALETMRALARRIQGMLDVARREHDVIKISCLDSRLTQLNVTIRSFESRMEQHQESIRSRNDERRNHHFRIMVILAQRARVLRNEAEGCVGADDVTFGRTEVTTTVDPSITDNDTTDWPEDPLDVLLRPPTASGYY